MEIGYLILKNIGKRMWKSGSKSALSRDESRDEAFAQQLQDEEIAYQLQFEDVNLESHLFQASTSSSARNNSEAPFPGTKSVVVTEAEENYLRAFGINLTPRILRKECGICMEILPHASFISTNGCAHEYCYECCKHHAEAKITSGSSQIKCPHPKCRHNYDIDQCRSLLSNSHFDTLNIQQTEAAIPMALRVYCPYETCSTFMEKLESGGTSFGTFVECYSCHRGFCLECNVPWHANQTCGEYRANEMNIKLSGDQKFRDLAQKEKWQNCPDCQRIVERTSGCKHMTCVCKNEFCYLCGKKYVNKVAGCAC